VSKDQVTEHIRVDLDGAVAAVTMAKPPHNLLNGSFIEDLLTAFEEAAANGARAILLRSEMKHFSAGADVDGFGADGRDGASAVDVLDRFAAIPIPTIAAVHGLALGGGFEIALACDFIMAGASSRLGLVETSIGLMPLLGGVQRVVERAGLARGKEIAMFGRRHEPELLERWGVINVVVADEALEDASRSWAQQLAAGPTVAYGAIKELAGIASNQGVRAADETQEAAANAVWASEDLKSGLESFAESGPGTAIFQGS
tara:strand:+ start:11367 stop:12143 length:777 start_codon:yes stop_codon:yes gene_type:complete